MFLYIKVWNKGIIPVTEIKNSPIIITGTSPYFKAGNNKPSASFAEVNRVSLPSAHYGIIDNVGSTEFINDADIARYYKVQKQWAQSLADRIGIPVEQIMARLPKIKTFGAEEALKMSFLAGFDPNENVIKANPIKELLNAHGGGDEPLIAHENMHAYYHNLRRAYAAQIPQEQLYQECGNIVLQRMLNGEHSQIIKGVIQKEVNGKPIISLEMMHVPFLSQAERQAVINAICSLQASHIDCNTAQLNSDGRKFIEETLIPHLHDYSKTFDGKPEEVTKKASKQMLDYINSFFARRNFLFGTLKSPGTVDLPGNLETLLSEKEINMARNSLNEFLPLQEKTLYFTTAKEVGPQAPKEYFMSLEETIAREEENIFRHNKVNQQIEAHRKNGFNPPESLLKEQQTAETNLRILSLTSQLKKVEEQMASAPKEPAKVSRFFKVKQGKEETFEEKPASFEQQVFKPHPMKRKHKKLRHKYNKLSKPENILADTPENNELRKQSHAIITEIKKLARGSDIDMPPSFVMRKDYKDFSARKSGQIFAKWARRLKVRLPY